MLKNTIFAHPYVVHTYLIFIHFMDDIQCMLNLHRVIYRVNKKNIRKVRHFVFSVSFFLVIIQIKTYIKKKNKLI